MAATTGGDIYKSTRLDEAGNVVLDDHPKPAVTDPAIDEEYATNVAADKAIDFIERHRDEDAPYFLRSGSTGRTAS